MNGNQQWYYTVGDQTYGPVTTLKVEDLIQQNIIVSSTWIVVEGTEDWTAAENSVFARHFPHVSPEQISSEPADYNGKEPPPIPTFGTVRSADMELPERTVLRTNASRVRAFLPFRLRSALLTLGVILLGSWTLLFLYYRYRESSEPQQHFNTTQNSLVSSESGRESSKPAARTLVVKGLCIGMPGEEAARNIALNGHGRIWTRPSTFVNDKQAHGYDIVFNEDDDPKGSWTGQIWTDEKTDRVTVFFFRQELTDFLFNTTDQSAKEFAQSFIDSYGVPSLTRSEFSGKPGWTYKSPQGWTLWIMPDKTIDVSKTLKRDFD